MVSSELLAQVKALDADDRAVLMRELGYVTADDSAPLAEVSRMMRVRADRLAEHPDEGLTDVEFEALLDGLGDQVS